MEAHIYSAQKNVMTKICRSILLSNATIIGAWNALAFAVTTESI